MIQVGTMPFVCMILVPEPGARGLGARILPYTNGFPSIPVYFANIRFLLLTIATSLGLEFSTHKTDLIHWRTPREKVARSEHPIVVDSECIQLTPKAVKWLGFYFENNHGTWTHYANRLALAQAAFDSIKRLSSLGSRLTLYSAGRKVKAIIIPTLLYGVESLDPSAIMRHKMEVLLN